MGKSNVELLKIAQKYIGSGGSRFRKFCGLPSGAAYCNAYVDYIANEGGDASLFFDGKRPTYCPDSIRWCNKNLALVPLYLALPMDLIYFDWEKNGVPNHIGFVRAKKSTSEIFTIEGNTNGGIVAQKCRTATYVQGVYRPHFAPPVPLKRKKLSIDGDFSYQSIYMLQLALSVTANGVLTKGTVKALQKAAGVKQQDGAFGPATARAVQRLVGAKPVDGQFGPKSIRKLQEWINKVNYPSNNKKPSETKPAPPESTPTTYSGAFPVLPPKTAKIAVECAYVYGTKLSRYRYKGGKPKEAYKKRLNQAYPNRKSWKYAKSRAGASCDVFAGTVLKCAGYKSAPHAMSKMVAWCKKHLKAVKTMQNGDILTRTNHVMICVDIKGKKRVANAHFQDHGGTYGIIQSVGKYTNIWRPSGTSYFSKGDTFTDVRRLQRFLNWYGEYKLKEDYIFGDKTEAAVKDFQTKEGLTASGRFGSAELTAAKKVRK